MHTKLNWKNFRYLIISNFLAYSCIITNNAYELHTYSSENYICVIFTGNVENGEISQIENDEDKLDFETNFKNNTKSITYTNEISITLNWSEFKSIYNTKNLFPQFIELSCHTYVFATDGMILYKTVIYNDDTIIPENNPSYTRAQSIIDLADFTNLKGYFNKTLDPRGKDGKPRVAIEKVTDSKVTIFTHNFCDKTTWYTKSVKITETPTDSGNHTTYNLSHQNVIDLTHFKITKEERILAPDTGTYQPIVTVDNVVKEEQDSHYMSGGDYTINYTTGVLTFLTPLTELNVVSITYYYATTSEFYIQHDHTDININAVEVQISDDIILTDSLMYTPVGLADTYAPELVPGVLPSGSWIQVGLPTIWNSVLDIINESNCSYPPYEAIGGIGNRGLQCKTFIFSFDYTAAEAVPCSLDIAIEVKTKHHEKLDGTYGIATFYCNQSNGL